jgi:G3E family GTPase
MSSAVIQHAKTDAMQDQRIPVTIITGFLGAGKTTLLNFLNDRYKDKRFAIIENEFGEIGIDNDLVVASEDGLFEMSNGCICCELNDELVEVLVKILNSKHDIDHLIIETTGMAEPDGVAQAFIADPEVQQYFRLDGTICLVDANHIEDTLKEREEARRQVTFADHIIINKKSEVGPDYLQEIKHRIQHMNRLASIEMTDYSRCQADVLSLNAYELKTIEQRLAEVGKEGHHHHHDHDHVCGEHCDHDHEHHHSDVNSHSFIFTEPFDLLKFRHWINVLLMLQGERIYRAKGIIHFIYKEEKVVFQSVRQMHAFQAGEPWGTEPRESRLVFIGPGLERAGLEKALRSCLHTASYYG